MPYKVVELDGSKIENACAVITNYSGYTVEAHIEKCALQNDRELYALWKSHSLGSLSLWLSAIKSLDKTQQQYGTEGARTWLAHLYDLR